MKTSASVVIFGFSVCLGGCVPTSEQYEGSTLEALGMLFDRPSQSNNLSVVDSCPMGTMEGTDNWGNDVCVRIGTNEVVSFRGQSDGCPTGTYNWLDEYGNKVCRSLDGSRDFYDTSKGCPIGTFLSFDSFGNEVCKRI